MKFTPAGLQKIKNEIKKTEEELKETLAAKGEAAETGGNAWHDNFAFEQLVQQENELVQKLNQLKKKLNESKLTDGKHKEGILDIGSKVTLQFGSGTQKTFTIGDSETAEPDKKVISYASPLGKALLKGKVGEEKEYSAGGRNFKVKILKIL